jgi:hypothetical protein
MANWYVDSAATGTNAGTSWTNAAINCQQILGQACSGSFTTASSTITLAANNNLAFANVAGTAVYDVTKGASVGTVSSISGTTLTLQSASLINSSGAADVLVFGGPTAVVAAGDSIFAHNTSAETYSAATTLTFPGTNAAPNYIYSTDTTNTPPQAGDELAGARIITTGNAALIVGGNLYTFGITLTVGSSSTASGITLGATSGQFQVWDTPTFDLSAQTGNGTVNSGNVGLRLLSPTFKFGASGQTFTPSFTYIKGGSVSAGTVPTNFVTSQVVGTLIVKGFDFSAYGSGKTLVSTNANHESFTYFENCKISSSLTAIASTPTDPQGQKVYVSRTDSSPTTNQFQLFAYEGTETSNLNSIYRSGGSAAFDGTAFSKKIVTTANAKVIDAFESFPMSVVNTRVGSTRTVTVYGVWDSPYGANDPPEEQDIWIEVEYPQDSGDPLGGYINSATGTSSPPNPLTASATAYTQDAGSTWNGTSGFTHPTAWTMSVSFTAELEGPLTVRVYCAKASTTFYIDGDPVLS